jgi:thioredoxin 2
MVLNGNHYAQIGCKGWRLMQIVCHHCSAINRVPEARLQDHPVCGKCKHTLLPDHPISLTDSNFNVFVSQTEVPVLVDFWADWCGPCKAMAPQFEIASQHLPNVIFAKVDTESNAKTSVAHFIRSIPTLILFHRGKEIAKQAGAMSASDLIKWVNAALGKQTP